MKMIMMIILYGLDEEKKNKEVEINEYTKCKTKESRNSLTGNFFMDSLIESKDDNHTTSVGIIACVVHRIIEFEENYM